MDLPEQSSTSHIPSFIRTYKKPLAIIILLVAALYLFQQYSKVTRTVTVNGTGSVQIKPEKAIVSFSYSHDSLTQAEAITAGESKFESIINGLAQFSPKELSKATYQISNSTKRLPTMTTDNKTSLVAGYQYVNAAKITIDKPEKVNDLVKYLYNNGASVVTQVRFVPKDQADADKKAREAALKDAHSKASQLAKAGGARVGKVLSIQEGTSTGEIGSAVMDATTQPQNSASKTGKDQQESANGIEIQAAVTAVYELTTPIIPWLPW